MTGRRGAPLPQQGGRMCAVFVIVLTVLLSSCFGTSSPPSSSSSSTAHQWAPSANASDDAGTIVVDDKSGTPSSSSPSSSSSSSPSSSSSSSSSSFRRGLRAFPGVQLFYSSAGETAPKQQPYPLPSKHVDAILLTSEANVGDTGVLLPLVLSFYRYHDAATNAVVLLSTASTSARRAEWTAWGARHDVIVGFVKPPHERVVIGTDGASPFAHTHHLTHIQAALTPRSPLFSSLSLSHVHVPTS